MNRCTAGSTSFSAPSTSTSAPAAPTRARPFFLPKIVGWGRTTEMCMTGERVDADEAYRIGLANHVHTREDLLPAAKATATIVCSKNKFGLRLTKDAFNAALNGSSLEDANRMEDRNQALIIANAIAEGAKQLG